MKIWKFVCMMYSLPTSEESWKGYINNRFRTAYAASEANNGDLK